ncbi:hypothetical protein M2D63_018495 [Pseudomonas sp. BJa5]|uniref:hypothetical protein n=1 Tax=Pseudomonas sp. BJa5 TaxID=2936270 RepID=UPI0025596846|nr:hypothetical protein [Pseudomonas sp. BGr12]MDL2423106.1 hypothetical protein [Pseudomonas sp. BGr12]
MSRHIATFVQISQLALRQGLFFSLALLLTLVAGQLHHTWQVAHDARAVPTRSVLVVKVPVPTASVLMQTRPMATTTVTIEAPVPRERWVF